MSASQHEQPSASTGSSGQGQQQQELQFAPWSVAVDVSFWFELARRKLEQWRLSEALVPLWAAYNATAGAGAAPVLHVGMEAFADAPGAESRLFATRGQLLLLNTLEAWTHADRPALLAQHAAPALRAAVDADDAAGLLAPLLLLVHADLKQHRFRHSAALPVLPLPAHVLRPAGPAQLAPAHHTALAHAIAAARTAHRPPLWLALEQPDGSLRLVELAGARAAWHEHQQQQQKQAAEAGPLLALVDGCGLASHPGWAARNVLFWAARRLGATRVRLLLLREGAGRSLERSLLLHVGLGAAPADVAAVGWERGAPRCAELAGLMEPRRLAATALDLNLQLMRWRAAPSLPLERVAALRCLLVGAGTLGCNVARQLLGWGVRHLTLVDSGRVAYSNPARQSLFEFADARDGGQPKAACAAAHLQRIFPDVEAKGVELRVPMPGHALTDRAATETAAAQLEALVQSHDAVFLLTDSREARWLPALLAAKHSRLAITAALGFDSFVVLRHGVAVAPPAVRLGCYFCNDVTAPGDSQRDRTLDQQCTVARPGASMLASALAAEMLVALVAHPQAGAAPPLLPPEHASEAQDEAEAGALGGVPHQVRGWLGAWRQSLLTGVAFSGCVACGAGVQAAYGERGVALVADVCAPGGPALLEQLAGLSALHAAAAQPALIDLLDDDE